jgi:NAD(P)H-dependent FMN reductase
MSKIRILAISGSLSRKSSNLQILQHIARIAGENIRLDVSDSIRKLPHFDPQLDTEPVPVPVLQFREELKNAHAILICTPEYAFGVPGALKNALDWTVSSGEFVNKPLALITASLSGEKAQASLLQTFKALSANIKPETTLLLPFIRSKLDEQGHFKNNPDEMAVKNVLAALIKSITD